MVWLKKIKEIIKKWIVIAKFLFNKKIYKKNDEESANKEIDKRIKEMKKRDPFIYK